MDCEKFETTMMDELYGELDELTSAAAKRHLAGCARCAELYAGLRATRLVAKLPVVEAPDDLEDRILNAARDAQKVVPFKQRLARAVSGAGSWAMRPQTAMAALFLVMIGTSALFLRGRRSKAPSTASVTITDRGAPAQSPTPVAAQASAVDTPNELSAHGAPKGTPLATVAPSDNDLARASDEKKKDSPQQARGDLEAKPGRTEDDGLLPPAAAPAAPPPMAAATGGFAAPRSASGGSSNVDTSSGMAAYNAGRYDDATRLFDAAAPGDTASELWAARSTREGHGCRAAVARFDKAAARAAGTTVGYDAKLEGGVCYRQLGNYSAASQRFNDLLTVPSHAAMAQAELAKMTPPATAAKPKAAAAPPAKASPPANVDQTF
jgi:hypothetical protein